MMTKKLMIVMMALGLTNAFAQEAEELSPLQEAWQARNALETPSEKEAAAAAMGAEFGPATLDKLRSGEDLENYEAVVLSWYIVGTEGPIDMELVREVVDTITTGKGSFLAEMHPHVPEDFLLEYADKMPTWPARLAYIRRSWGSASAKEAFLTASIGPKLGAGERAHYYKALFRAYVRNLPAAEAVPVLEDEVRGLLSVPASEGRDEWIKELRAQYVILREMAGE